MVRVLIAGIVGGIFLFVGGAFCHMVLGLEFRTFGRFADEGQVREFIQGQNLEPGIYGFPQLDANFDRLSSADQTSEEERLKAAYREGPTGYWIIAPNGEDMAGPRQFGSELVANILAAFMAAFVAAHLSSYTTFVRRWLLIALIGPVAWLSLVASYAIWYRYPIPFVLDGLYAAIIEWVLAGAAIAFIVRPIMHSR